MNLLSILLMGGRQPGAPEPTALETYGPLILVIVVFYFFFIRPQMKKSKEQKNFRAELKKGDEVLTIGGIDGKVVKIDETTVVIETEGQTKIRVVRSAVVPKDTPLGQTK